MCGYNPFYWLDKELDRDYEEQFLDKEKAANDDEKTN